MADEEKVTTPDPQTATDQQAPTQESGKAAETTSTPADEVSKEATKSEEASPAPAPAEAKPAEPVKVIPKHHFTIIDLFLLVCSIFFVLCCVGMITSYANIALIGGLVLVFVFISGLFYATLHLSKVG